MKAWRAWFGPVAVLLLMLLAFGWLFQLRLGGGDVYPEYSSLRADALGTRAFYEALAQVPGMRVDRDYRPIERLGVRPRLLLLPGLVWQDWQSVPVAEIASLNAAASAGARVVLAFRADLKREARDEQGRPIVEDDESGKKADAEKKGGAESKSGPSAKELKKKEKLPGYRERVRKDLAKEWRVAFKQRWLMAKEEKATIVDEAPAGLPPEVEWHSDLYFSPEADSGWRVVYRRAGEPVLLEKTVGRGSIVLISDAFCLSNEALHRARATALLSWLVGDQRRVTFLEGALGVLEENGIGFLARRYGLGGAMALLALLGGLYAWRRMVAFLPATEAGPAGADVALAYEPTAGFTGLLRRSLGREEVLPACLEEWRRGRRGGGAQAAARVEAAWLARDPEESPAKTYNALARALKPR